MYFSPLFLPAINCCLVGRADGQCATDPGGHPRAERDPVTNLGGKLLFEELRFPAHPNIPEGDVILSEAEGSSHLW